MPLILLLTGVVVCAELSGKKLHRQVGIGRVVTSGNLGGVMVITLTRNARDMGSIPTLSVLFRILTNLMMLVAMTKIMYKVHSVCLLNLPCVLIYNYIAFM